MAGDLSPGDRPGALRQGDGPGGDGLRVAGHPPGGRRLSGAGAPGLIHAVVRRGVAYEERAVRCGLSLRPWAKCRGCPLYDPEWALESWVEPTWSLAMGEEGPIVVPDHLPEDWA